MKLRSIELQALIHASEGRSINPVYLDKDAQVILAWIDKYRLTNDQAPSAEMIGAKFGVNKLPTGLDSHEEVCRILKESYTRKTMEGILDEADGLPDPVSQALFIQTAMAKLNEDTADQESVAHSSDFEGRAASYREFVAAGKTTTVAKFGIPTLDRELYGMEVKDLCILMARSSAGKSTLARRIALNMRLQDKHVLYITLEEDGDQTSKIFDALIGGVSPMSYIRMKLSPDELDTVVKANRKIAHIGKITVLDNLAQRSVGGVGQAILKYRPDVVILDQLTNIAKSTDVKDFTQTTRDLKQLCRWAPIMALTQMSKTGEAKYAEGVFQDADKLFKLSDDPKTPTQEKSVFVDKHRKGRRFFEVPLLWDPAKGICEERTQKANPYAKNNEKKKEQKTETKEAGWNDDDEWS